ncbi:phosphodiester glycosidase family protein [Tepidimicrobium xylanilyticum]|uniref:phosphodiester glycosidase family protein n=1 Tax=Tepidimicrobium xylanilyticum TaxID=1123352 RepID=UPI001356316E|nr:phosphodiester glycosidase family protein [Tepidimicrobium xylanilyticum]GMG95565.1 hypothetical protein EN5CB1_03910 [Tepidimicrobium xylanilyticum]
MNRNIRKVFLFLLIIGIIIASSNSYLAVEAVNMPYEIYRTSSSEYLGSGILYENIRRFTSDGWWNINVIRVDLTDEYAEIGGLFSNKGLSNRDTVSNLVKEKQAVAGINGDFFNYNPIPHPIGTMIENGEIISSPPEKAYAPPTFYLDIDNVPDITFFDRSMQITSLNSGQSLRINFINKASYMEYVTLLNKHWGTSSFGKKYNGEPIKLDNEANGNSNGDVNEETNGNGNNGNLLNSYNNEMVEMVVIDNIVSEIRIGQDAVTIPENGFIIATRGEKAKELLTKFNVGDEVKLTLGTSPNLENIKFAISGGSIILKDGNITNTNINIAGKHPRTGIGITKDRKELIIATIDGRDSSFVGVSQEIFGAILKDLGAYDAINLDGGGSTTMVIKPVDEQVAKVINKPSDGGERRVVNGVGVFSNAPKGELSYIKITTDDTNMFANTSRKFTIKGYDQYHNPIEIDQNKVEYAFEGVEGEIVGNVFKAKSPGKAIIKANYEGITSTIELKVLDEIKSIIFPTDKLSLHANENKTIGAAYGMDKNGFKAKIYAEDIDWTTTGNIGYVENGVFYSNGNIGTGAITGRIGKALNNILVSVGSGEAKLIDGFEDINKFSSTVYPEYVKGSIELVNESKEGNKGLKLRYDFTEGEDNRAAYIIFRTGEQKGLTLDGMPNKLSLWVKGDNNKSWLRGTIIDKNGKDYTIDFAKSIDFSDWKQVSAQIPSDVAYPIALEKIYVVETNSAKKYTGEILIDGLRAHYPPSYNNVEVPTPTNFTDVKNVKKEVVSNGFSFLISKLPSFEKGQEGLKDKITNKANAHELNVFIGKANQEFNKTLKSKNIINIATPYKTNRYKNLMIIDASSAKGGIRATNYKQWIWLQNGLSNAKEDHIFLFLDTPIFGSGGFTDKLEAELLHNTLVETFEKGKTVWVIYNGNSTKVELKDGIRYIEFNNKDIENLSFIEFVVNGKDITYQVMK